MAAPQTRGTFAASSGQRVFFSGNRFHQPHRFHRFHQRRFFFASSPCFNRSAFDPFFCNNGLVYPYYPLYPTDYSTPATSQPEQTYVTSEADASNRELSYEVQRLTDEVESLRDQERRRNQQDEAPADKAKAPTLDDGGSRVLVFRDGRQLLVENYAVSGNTIWVLGERTRKFPLSDIDVAATQKANADNGDEFHLPSGTQRR